MSLRAPYFVALDYGTGGAKCAVFDVEGRCASCVREPWTYTEVPLEGGLGHGYAFDPDAFWDALARCARSALAQFGIEPGQVAGVSTAAQRLGTVLLDARGREIYAGPNMDGRGFSGALEVMSSLGMEEAVAITGHWPPFVSSLARLLAHRARPEAPPVATILTLNDWLSYRLTGELFAEPSNAGATLLVDVRERAWSARIRELFAIDGAMLPQMVEPATPVGRVTAEAARATGLVAGTPVFAGGGDTQCALLGSAVVEPGEAGAVLGTTTPVMAATASPLFDPSGKLWTGCHVLPDRWTVESNAGDTGIAYEWMLETFGLAGEAGFGEAEAAVAARPPGPPPVFGVAGPQIWDLLNFRPNQALGFVFPHPPFTRRPGRAEFLHAFLLNVVCAIRANLEQIEALCGAPVASLTLSGGMTRSPSLLAGFASLVDRPLQVSAEHNATALGAAVLAAAGSGAYPSIADAARAMVRKRALARDAALSEEYEAYYARWRELYGAVRELPA